MSFFERFSTSVFFQTFGLQVEPRKEKKVGDHVTAGGRGNLGGHQPSLPASSLLVDGRPGRVVGTPELSSQGGRCLPPEPDLHCWHRVG